MWKIIMECNVVKVKSYFILNRMNIVETKVKMWIFRRGRERERGRHCQKCRLSGFNRIRYALDLIEWCLYLLLDLIIKSNGFALYCFRHFLRISYCFLLTQSYEKPLTYFAFDYRLTSRAFTTLAIFFDIYIHVWACVRVCVLKWLKT